MLRKPRVFTRFSDREGYGSVPAFSLFSFARFSKTASETNFEHFSSHAWPKNIDFVASETIRKHFPSLIEPCMVRKYSFRCFWNSFWTFPMADPEAQFWHFLVLGSGMLIELLTAYFRHFSALSLPRKYPLFNSRNSFWEFLGSWSEILDFKFECMFSAFLHLAADLLCAKPAFSKHVDNQLFFWPRGLAVLSVSLFCLYASLR